MDSDNSSILSGCSSPLSCISFSPSPPPELLSYPSPPSSQDSDLDSNDSEGMDSTIIVASDKDGPPPAKKRRIGERKPRTTERLDLRYRLMSTHDQAQMARLKNVLENHQKIVVIAGAGISVAAGIPDFRSSTGLFTSLRAEHNLKGSGKDLFDASVYSDESSTESFHHMVKEMSKMTKGAKPTEFHHMLATLAQEGRLLRLYTQNIDGIDTSMEPLATTVPLAKKDGKWPKTVQLHGGLDKMVCSKCNELSDFDADRFDGPLAPICEACVEIDRLRTDVAGKRSHGIGRLRPRMVLYNEHNPDDEAIGNVVKEDMRKRPDAIIVVGTSLKIPGVKRIVREMCGIVRDRRDGLAVWINNDPEPVGAEFKDCWDIVVRGKCDDVARRVDLGRWDEQGSEPSEKEWNEAIQSNKPRIVINPTFKGVDAKATFRRAPRSPEFSPFTTRTHSVLDDSEMDDVVVGAPPTPSKSRRSSPVKPKATAFDAMNGKKAPAPKKQSKKAPPKTVGVRKPAAKTQRKPVNKITQTMTQSKAFVEIPGKRKRAADPVMRSVSPENARVNSGGSSPTEIESERIHKRMSIDSLVN